jgi:hypothetical protein
MSPFGLAELQASHSSNSLNSFGNSLNCKICDVVFIPRILILNPCGKIGLTRTVSEALFLNRSNEYCWVKDTIPDPNLNRDQPSLKSSSPFISELKIAAKLHSEIACTHDRVIPENLIVICDM